MNDLIDLSKGEIKIFSENGANQVEVILQDDSIWLSAEKIGQLGVNGISQIVFVIGGSLGLSKKVLERADYKLSFSRMTFPHQLMRVILLEQIYRSYRILNHQPYHK